ncbi:MAG: histidine kinase [Saprospiraceae bacterium]|nr:histidine kinase [Saprospiraceae bacterium]
MPSFVSMLLSGRARLITHLTGWTFVFVSFFYLFSQVRPPGEALMRTVMNLAFMLALYYGNAKLLVNRYLEPGRYRELIVYLLLFWLGMAALRTWVELNTFGGNVFVARTGMQPSWVRMFVVYSISYFLLLLFSTLYQLVENRHALELRHRELETRHVEAQLNYLKAQINPHFLFNTLNNIYAAATLQHPRTADMVLRLSDLLRYVTYDAQAGKVPLDREIEQIRAYIDLFEMKSEQPLPIGFTIEGDTAGVSIEPVLLLPLVENALKHGDLDVNPAAFLHLHLKCLPGEIYFEIKNTFSPADQQKDEVGGVGLENIRRRLELNYPDRHALKAGENEGVFEVTLSITYDENKMPAGR